MPRASELLPSLGHAASGAGGTVISTLATYPLDLVNTRLKVQRQLRADGTIDEADAYRGIIDAFHTIYTRQGGLRAFFPGLGPDLAKSAADSFLFFLFYTASWFRARRLHARNNTAYLNTLEEIAVGAAAGACAKAFTTPVSNVVTRRQTASLLDAKNEKRAKASTFGGTVAEIRREKGVLGLWAGYSASLVLTLNPSMTFFLQQMLKRVLVAREKWDEPGRQVTFLLAALSKVAATCATYPFQIAKARVQVSAPSGDGNASAGVRSIVKDTIFVTVVHIAKTEGIKALYDGIGGELLKGFFNHGTTMMSKDIIHGFLVRFYLALLILLQRYPQIRTRVLERARSVKTNMRHAPPLSQMALRRSLEPSERTLRGVLIGDPKSIL